jgi:hypothetical protein
MNERAPPPERRSICIGGLRHGPDTLGRGRHTEALLKLFATYASVPLGSTGIASGYFFTSDGIFSDKPVPDKVIAVRYHAPSNQIYAELGFSPTTITLPEEDYRKKVADLLIEGAGLRRRAVLKDRGRGRRTVLGTASAAPSQPGRNGLCPIPRHPRKLINDVQRHQRPSPTTSPPPSETAEEPMEACPAPATPAFSAACGRTI